MIGLIIVDKDKNTVPIKISYDQFKVLEIDITKAKRNKTLKDMDQEIHRLLKEMK